MASRAPPTDETTRTSVGRAALGLHLRVAAPANPRLEPLPPEGEVVVGRSADAAVRIDDPSISRRHAVLRVGDAVTVEDLGSANGTRVRGAAAAPGARVEVRPGDVIEFGTVLCTLVGEAPAGVEAPADGDVVVADPAMRRLHALLDRAAGGDIHVLLLGETGVGKEVFAERLHRRSPRRDRPFVKVNCAALTETLVESELFGHERGAFSGAVAAKAGLLETAEGGTVFLDEVGELSLTLQAKLLRVLEDRLVRRVGGTKAHPVDVRVVSATNRDLEAEVAAGRYRSDLYFRLGGFVLTIPPLRERVGEIAPLAASFARASAGPSRRPAPAISGEAMALLTAYHWPGNIRELRNVMARAVLLSSGGSIAPEHLPVERMRPAPASPAAPTPPAVVESAAPLPDALRAALGVVERQRIVDALDRCAGNQTRAAQLLGISRRALVTKLEQHDLPRPRKGREG